MRAWFLPVLGLVVVAALLIVDPVALVRLGYHCAVGGRGVRPVWVAGSIALIALACGVRAALRARVSAEPVRRKPQARRSAAARKPAPQAKSRARARTAKRPR